MSNGAGGGQTNTVAPPPTLVKICFYTIGDNKPIKDSAGTGSQWFYARAATLASDPKYIFGSNSAYAAIQVLQALDPSVKIVKLYFLGHGNPRGFFFDESNSECLSDPASTDPKVSAHGSRDSGDFLNELAKHLAPGFQIGFLGCRMGNNLVPALATALSGKGASGSIFGYINYCTLGLEDPSKGDYDAPGQEFTETINGKTWHHNQIPQPEKTVNVTP